MNILIVCNSIIPAKLYGGIERVVWDLGKELTKLKHRVTFLAKNGSYCDFADVLELKSNLPFQEQIPKNIDIVHFHLPVKDKITTKNITTIHGNGSQNEEFDVNTVFVSKDHAKNHDSESFVYNGLDWNNYIKPDLSSKRIFFHFLGNAAWKVKNLKGAIKTSKKANEKLAVIGGKRISTRMGLKINFSPYAKFYGMLSNNEKAKVINKSKGLIFPVLWDEPFGLAIIESMYYGCPVFGTPYGSLPELIKDFCGVLSDNSLELSQAIKNHNDFNKTEINRYVADNFNSEIMALNYIEKYEKVLKGETLNKSKPKNISNQTNYKFY